MLIFVADTNLLVQLVKFTKDKAIDKSNPGSASATVKFISTLFTQVETIDVRFLTCSLEELPLDCKTQVPFLKSLFKFIEFTPSSAVIDATKEIAKQKGIRFDREEQFDFYFPLYAKELSKSQNDVPFVVTDDEGVFDLTTAMKMTPVGVADFLDWLASVASRVHSRDERKCKDLAKAAMFARKSLRRYRGAQKRARDLQLKKEVRVAFNLPINLDLSEDVIREFAELSTAAAGVSGAQNRTTSIPQELQDLALKTSQTDTALDLSGVNAVQVERMLLEIEDLWTEVPGILKKKTHDLFYLRLSHLYYKLSRNYAVTARSVAEASCLELSRAFSLLAKTEENRPDWWTDVTFRLIELLANQGEYHRSAAELSSNRLARGRQLTEDVSLRSATIILKLADELPEEFEEEIEALFSDMKDSLRLLSVACQAKDSKILEIALTRCKEKFGKPFDFDHRLFSVRSGEEWQALQRNYPLADQYVVLTRKDLTTKEPTCKLKMADKYQRTTTLIVPMNDAVELLEGVIFDIESCRVLHAKRGRSANEATINVTDLVSNIHV